MRAGLIGDQIFQLSAAARYWVDAPDSGPEGFGVQLSLVLLFQK